MESHEKAPSGKMKQERKNKVDKALHDPRIRKTLQDRERKAFDGEA